jgi:hypothetical protein
MISLHRATSTGVVFVAILLDSDSCMSSAVYMSFSSYVRLTSLLSSNR